jgi:uncharacterized protein YpmS
MDLYNKLKAQAEKKKEQAKERYAKKKAELNAYIQGIAEQHQMEELTYKMVYSGNLTG